MNQAVALTIRVTLVLLGFAVVTEAQPVRR